MTKDGTARHRYLISRHLDGSLSESEMDELEALVSDSPAVAEQLADAARMHVAMTQTAKQLAAESPLREAMARRRRNRARILLPLAAALVLVGLLLSRRPAAIDRPIIVKTVGVSATGDAVLAAGQYLADESVTISAGAVHLSYPGVAEVVIEAPARFQAGDGYQLLLHSGKLTANVIDETSAFTVLTDELEVIDRGTKFAVDAIEGRAPEVHVFEGRVDARARSKNPTLTSVVAGEAMHIDSRGALVSRSFRNGSFLHAMELRRLAHGWEHQNHVDQWRAYAASLKTHPHLISYFQLERGAADDRFVDYGSKIHGAKWVQGRWPGEYALDFSERGDHIDVSADAHATHTVDELTMIAWARLDATPSGFNSLYHTHGWQKPGQVHWMVVNGNTMRLAIYGNTADPKTSTDIYSTSIPLVFEFGQWVHLAVAYNRHEKTTRFFINAEMANEVRDTVTYPAVVGPGQIGNWNSQPRKFGGRLDELLLFSKALSRDEIREHYLRSSPYVDTDH